jgi:hypothetical protein
MHPLSASIDALHRRLVRQDRVVAVCRTLATVVAVAVALGLLDYVVRFTDRGLRVMITAMLGAASTWALYRWWWLPRRKRPGPLGVARQVESHFPQLRDRLASALEFLGQSEEDPTAGSAALRRAVVSEADLAVSELPIDTVIDRRPLRQATTWAAIALAVVVIGLIFDTGAVGTAIVRLVAPWGSTEWPRENHLAFRDPPTRLAVGQAFEVELFDRGGMLPENVRIEYRDSRGGRTEVQSEWMMRVGDVMVARRDDVRESFAFRAVGGDDRTMRWHDVEVVAPPKLDSIVIAAYPPPYTGLPAATSDGHLRVLAGTGIEVAGTASEPLGAARILYDDAAIDATIGPNADGAERRSFFVAADRFVAGESGPYAIELANADGVAGVAGEWSLRVEPDTQPSVAWQRPQADLFVLPTATVPLAVAVKDNLAIARVALEFERSDQPDETVATIELYRGTEQPASPANSGTIDGETRIVDYTWPLAALQLPVGTQLMLDATAADYRPGVGRTATPRRITIIGREELDARIADRQSQIVRRLEEVLNTERNTRDEVTGIEIQLRDAGRLAERDKDLLQSVELAQRRVARSLTDASDGVPALTAALVDELRTNGLESDELIAHMQTLEAALERLAAGPLGTADQELTSARKAANTDDMAALARSLGTAGNAQEEVLRTIEESLSELEGWADYGRLVRDLAQLRADQMAHLETTRREVGLATLPLELRELNRQQRTTLNKAAAAEDAIARRYERIEVGLDALAKELASSDSDAAGRLADAVDLARDRGIANSMRQTTRDLAANRVGQALVREAEIVRAIDEVLDLLRDRTTLSPEELIARLQAAEQKLAALRGELSELQRDLAAAEKLPDAAKATQSIRERQQQLRQQISRLGRELARLDAAAASRSTRQAADKLAEQADSPPPQPPQPANSRDVERAEQDLAEAARQLAERRAQAEDDWAQKFLERFQVALAAMVADQKTVIATTEAIDKERGKSLTPNQIGTVKDLSAKEHQLADEALAQAEWVSGLQVFGVALANATEELNRAAEQLDADATGETTQQAERRALERFEQIVWALEQTAAQAQQPPPPGEAGNAGAGGQQPRPLFDLFEVKLLRMLQADLNQRTQQFHDRTLGNADPAGKLPAADFQAAQQLAAEQRRLAELAAELAARDSEGEEHE